jgi:hypothetical protein
MLEASGRAVLFRGATYAKIHESCQAHSQTIGNYFEIASDFAAIFQ